MLKLLFLTTIWSSREDQNHAAQYIPEVDFPPEVGFSDDSKIEYLSETKLLGVIVSDNLKWHKNTLYICQKASAKLWLLRRTVKLQLFRYL